MTWSSRPSPPRSSPTQIGILEAGFYITQSSLVHKIWQFKSTTNWLIEIKLHVKFGTYRTSNKVISSLNTTLPFIRIHLCPIKHNHGRKLTFLISHIRCNRPIIWSDVPLSKIQVRLLEVLLESLSKLLCSKRLNSLWNWSFDKSWKLAWLLG